jgi:sRNA-binding protein
MPEVTEYRHNRNWVRLGDTVKVKPVGRQSFIATVLRIQQEGERIEVEVRDPYNGAIRTVTPERITRKAQSKAGA